MNHSDLVVETNDLQVSEKDLTFPDLQSIKKGVYELYKLGQLPVFELAHQAEHLSQILQTSQKMKQEFDTLLLVGIGGSALGAQFLAESLAYSVLHASCKKFYLCDHVDADVWNTWREQIDFKKTLIVVVSKSGRTIETLSAYLFFKKVLEDQVGPSSQKHFVFITDPKEGLLRKIAQEQSITTFDIPPGIGGRYSILTSAGLFPAAFLGVSIEELVLGGAHCVEKYLSTPGVHSNPALLSALAHWAHEKKKRSLRVVFPYGVRLKSFGAWFAQLWAESLGKKYSLKGEALHAGTTPIASAGPADQHSQLQLYLEGPDDKVITFIRYEEAQKDVRLPETLLMTNGVSLKNLSVHALQKAEQQATAQALNEVGRPHQTIVLRHVDPYHIGQLIVFSELETIYSGALYNINPFDQPAVELIKKNISKFL